MALEASNGKTLPALTVFSESLRYLKDHALNTIQEASFQTVCDQEEITWVITVPAIWSAAARQFMRLAAKEVKAGVIPHPQIIFGDFFTQRNSSTFKQPVSQISVYQGEKYPTLRVMGERMSQTASGNLSALSLHHCVEMSPREISSARTTIPLWAPGVRTASLAGGIHAVISPPFLELTLLSCDFRQDLSLT